MSNGNLYPEKIAMYFSSMNSLSGKIFADIQAIEGTVKLDNNLSYNEKSKIIDKHLIHDVILRNKEKQQQIRNKNINTGKGFGNTDNNSYNNDELKQQGGDNEEEMTANQIYYDDPDLDKDQVTALLTSVYPKKPEKYIYDDNGFYLDEHSEPFSYCTQSQASFCDLEKLVRDLPSTTLPHSSIVRSNNNHRKSDSKSRNTGTTGAHNHHHRYHKEKKAPQPMPNSNTRRLSDEIIEHHSDGGGEDGEKKGSVGSSMKVKKMERESEYNNAHSNTMKQPSTLMGGVPIMGMSFLPSSSSSSSFKKCQNEKKHHQEGNEHRMSKKSEEDESNLPNQVQNSDLIAELQAKLKMNKGKSSLQHKPSLTKVNKPKAPPPPPPNCGGDKQEKPTSTKKTQPQMVTTGSSSSEKPENMTAKGLVSNNANSNVLATNTTTTTTTTNREKSSEEEFCVDVSSPCRIPTPRTGLDILDNW